MLNTQLISLDLLLRERWGALKKLEVLLLLLRYLPCRDLAHYRILKLEGFKKKGAISRDDRANVNSPSYIPVYLSM